MKYIARVHQVLQPDIHKLATIIDGQPQAVADMPLPNRVEIEPEGHHWMMFRYTDAGEFCGDT